MQILRSSKCLAERVLNFILSAIKFGNEKAFIWIYKKAKKQKNLKKGSKTASEFKRAELADHSPFASNFLFFFSWETWN